MAAITERFPEQTKQLRLQAGKWLKGLREARGLTQRELAESVGLRYYTFISQIESGQGKVPPEQYLAWARALDVDPREFVKNLLRYYDPHTYQVLFASAGAVGEQA